MKSLGRIVLGLVALVVWIACLETACWAYLRFMPSRFNPLSYYLIGMTQRFHPFFRPEGGTPTEKYYPYVGFFHEGHWDKTPPPVRSPYPDGWVLLTGPDKEGRERYATMDKPPGTLRVIALGGSTMAGMGQSSQEMAIPEQLGRLLRERYPGRKLEVLNAAYYTYIAAEEMVLLSTKLILFKPDLLVVLDGYNELISAYYYPDLPPLWGVFQQYMYTTFKRTQKITSMLAQLGYLLSKRFYCLAIPRVILYNRRTQPAPAVPGGTARPIDPKPYEAAVDRYLLMQRTMVGIARANHIPIVLALQPNVNFKKPLSEDEKSVLRQWNDNKPRYSEAAGIFFPALDRAYDKFIRSRADGAAAPSEFGGPVQVVKLNGLFARHPETLYVDSCHYNDRGAALIARALAPLAAAGLRLAPAR